ncbi:MAG: glycosyltransferase family 4 protein [Aerococcus sp.]|nr:glycosyltransferase family 4 protein [Aerococcus sp.]
MLHINMISRGEEVKGQGVGTAYESLMDMLQRLTSDDLALQFNQLKGADLNHVHTVHPFCYEEMIRSSKPSCMHVHFLPETLEGSIALPSQLQKMFYKYVLTVYRTADELIVVNPIFIDALVDYGFDRDRITFIPNVVDRQTFKPLLSADRTIGYERYDLDPDRFTVLSVGQVQTRKGVLDFAEIARKMPDVQFLWAGDFSFGAITDGYEELKKLRENPPENLRFLGMVERSDMNLLYNICDCLLMTSYNELFPMAIIEAVNAGTPILLRDLDLYKEIYFTEYLRAANNDEFCDQLTRLAHDPALQLQAKIASRKIATDYAEEKTAKRWVEYYQQFYERWG